VENVSLILILRAIPNGRLGFVSVINGGNVRTNGWDERDYKLWSALGALPSYGRKDRTDHLLSLAEIEALLRKHAEERFAAQKTKPMTDFEARSIIRHSGFSR
jgi:hypothetical protein